jgi:hypothetical protein
MFRVFTGGGLGSQDERLRIDSSGRLIVGGGSDPAESTIVAKGNSTSATSYSVLDMRRGEAATSDGDVLGYIRFSDTNIPNTNNNYGLIFGACDGDSSGVGDNPGRLVFSTTADGASGPTERLRITSDGELVFAGDTDTFIDHPNANQIEITAGNIEVATFIDGQSNRPAMLIDKGGVNNTTGGANYNSNGNSNDLVIGNVSSGNHGMTICTPSSGTGTINFSDGSGGGADAYRGSLSFEHANELTVVRAKSGKVVLRNDATDTLVATGGKIGINESSPAARLHISTPASTTCELRLTANNTGSGSGDRGRINVYSSRNDGTAYQAGYVDIDRSSGTEDKAHLLVALNNGSGVGERLRINSDGDTHFTGQRHRFNFTNSGGVGPFLSLRNTGTAAGSITGICFGIGGSSADLDGSDWGEGQIKVYTDSGQYGNMEFNLHVNANRSFLKIVGNGQGATGAGAGTEGMRGGVAFGNAGIAIDRSWTGQPGIHCFNQNVEGDTDQATFRFHGWNRSYASYPDASGSDFGVSLVADGMTLTSDKRRKTDITTITGALNTVSQMRGVSFTYVNRDLERQTHMSMKNGKKLGFIAQEVIPLLPELILDSGEKAVELENGYCDRYNMDYGGVTPLLVEAIKELITKVETLEQDNIALRVRVTNLEGN